DRSLAERAHEFANVPRATVIVAADSEAERILGSQADLSLAPCGDVRGKLCLLRAAFKLSAERGYSARAQLALESARDELTEFHRIGTALMIERDKRGLIRQILAHALRHTGSDTAGIFIVEKNENGEPLLYLRLVHSDSLADVEPTGEKAPKFPFDATSMVGYAALTKRPLVVSDA